MDTSGVLTRGRARAESLMLDRGVMRRRTGRMVQDPVTDREVEVFEDLFTSKCKVQRGTGLGAQQQEAGARSADIWRGEVHLPASVARDHDVRVGDVWVMTALSDLSSMNMLGVPLRVVDPGYKSMATALRVQVEGVTS